MDERFGDVPRKSAHVEPVHEIGGRELAVHVGPEAAQGRAIPEGLLNDEIGLRPVFMLRTVHDGPDSRAGRRTDDRAYRYQHPMPQKDLNDKPSAIAIAGWSGLI